MAESRDRAVAAAAVALLLCACAVAAAAAAAGQRGRRSGAEPGAALRDLLRRNYSADSEGTRGCRGTKSFQDAAAAFQFDSPGLELLRCVAAEHAAREFGDGDAYVVLLSGAADSPSPYKCKVCDGAWHPVDRNPVLQRPLEECSVPRLLELDREGHPAGEAGRRLEGVRCHGAYRKGCDRGYGWCHGLCCRAEALFYYPQLQKPTGAGKLLTAKNAGPREAPLLRLLTPATKTAGAGR